MLAPTIEGLNINNHTIVILISLFQLACVHKDRKLNVTAAAAACIIFMTYTYSIHWCEIVSLPPHFFEQYF
uniref:Uncharacterized protein n=1 Tax=Setaria italica TaxID=4555 RepID=K3YXD9_SETIT